MIPLYAMLDVWMALGGDPLIFEEWMEHPKRTPADAWAALMSAVRGDIMTLLEANNPPVGQLLGLVDD